MATEIERAVALAKLEEKLNTLEKQISSLKKDRDRALIWGIIVLGTGLVSLVTWVFNHLVKTQ